MKRHSEPMTISSGPVENGGRLTTHCKCGQMPIPSYVNGIHWYWQFHTRKKCTLELPNSKCWCGLLRSEHITGHKQDVEHPSSRGNARPITPPQASQEQGEE